MRAGRGFTLIELMVVLAIVALMLTIAAPRYIDHVERARESTLRSSLKAMRDALGHFEADTGRSPASLAELVERRYLTTVPVDPITDRRDTWIVIGALEAGERRDAASVADNNPAGAEPGGVADVRSGAPGVGRDGRPYREW